MEDEPGDIEAIPAADQLREIARGGVEVEELAAEIGWQRVANMASRRQLRELVAKIVFAILGAQLVATNAIFFLAGINGAEWKVPALHYDRWVLELYTASTVVEIIGVAAVVVHSLFPKSDGHDDA